MLPVESGGRVSPYPTHTTPVSESEESREPHKLTQSILRLEKIYSWFLAKSPNNVAFPYHLQLVDVTDKDHPRDIGPGEKLEEYNLIRLDVVADRPDIEPTDRDKTYLYVFLLNSEGQSCLFYPDTDRDEGRVSLPRESAPLGRFPISPPPRLEAPKDPNDPCDKPDRQYDLCVYPPFGNDTYFLMASARYIPNPREVFEIDGVIEPGNPRERGDLTGAIAVGQKGARGTLKPVAWKLEWQTHTSIMTPGLQPKDVSSSCR